MNGHRSGSPRSAEGVDLVIRSAQAFGCEVKE
jgi:hypothetical protein